MSPRLRAYLVCLLAYLAALGVAALLTGQALAGDPFWDAAIADVAATLVIFAFSVGLSNSSMYDPYWSVAPPALFAYWLAEGATSPRAWIAAALVGVWGVRLTVNFLRGWPDLDHEDWRYPELRRKHGRAYWLISFLGIHFFPTVLTFAGSAALYVIATHPDASLGWLDAVGAGLTALGIFYEGVADEQLRAFRASDPPRGSWLATGLWRHTRHPNYFGEVTFWSGLACLGLAADPTAWWVLVGPLGILALFVFVSIPLIDERMRARRPGYAEHAKRVSRLVPWFVRGEGD